MKRFIVHIVLDEKFIDMALREFEAVAPGENKVVILGKPHALRFVKSKGVTFLSIWQAKKLVRSDECSAVIFHSLCDSFMPVLQSMPKKKQLFG